jgi:AcrR family transcriptional regulator
MGSAEVSAEAGAARPDGRPRPLRRDAERNRQRILRAASEVFTTRGVEATLDDIADHAGVGVGTVYRRFPDKAALIVALFEERLGTMVGLAEQGTANPDPWSGLVFFLEQAGGLLAGDRGLRQILMFASYGRDRVGEARARLLPVVSELVTRAQADGSVRADLRPTDIPLIEFMLAMLAEYAHPVRPDVWRRYLAIILDGLRPGRATPTPLPEPPLNPAEIGTAMRGMRARGRPARQHDSR